MLEGPHLISAALDAGASLGAVVASPEFLAGAEAGLVLPRLPRPPLEVASELLDGLLDADSPKGLAATTRLPRLGPDALPRVAGGLYLFLDGIQDPGNLGALARVGEAAGGVAVVLAAGCAHPYHPRALRASAGSLLRLPAAVGCTIEAIDRRLAGLAPRWVALEAHHGVPLQHADLEGTVVLALGAEGPGLSPHVAARADQRMTIPLAPPVESLNVAVAAAVVLFERRRRQPPG